MGYTTDFVGHFSIDRPLDEETKVFLQKLARTRRMVRRLDSKYGIEGEFYVDGSGSFGQGHDSSIVDYNKPPCTQPGLWCQWTPSDDGLRIEWDGGEKFYNYVEWIQYIINRVLHPKNYILNGEVCWQGEEHDDFGKIVIVDNIVYTKMGEKSYGSPRLA
jgi:hypothetical protein